MKSNNNAILFRLLFVSVLRGIMGDKGKGNSRCLHCSSLFVASLVRSIHNYIARNCSLHKQRLIISCKIQETRCQFWSCLCENCENERTYILLYSVAQKALLNTQEQEQDKSGKSESKIRQEFIEQVLQEKSS